MSVFDGADFNEEEMKYCAGCGEIKNIGKFGKNNYDLCDNCRRKKGERDIDHKGERNRFGF